MEQKVPFAVIAALNGMEMKMLPWSVTEKTLRDAEEMRAFYTSVGLSEQTIERALEAKFGPPAPERRGTWVRKGQPKTRGRHVKKV
jgi:hypothetical protein